MVVRAGPETLALSDNASLSSVFILPEFASSGTAWTADL